MSIRVGPQFDRWLMRAKDIVQLAVAVGSALYVSYKFVSKIDHMNATISQVQREVAELRVNLKHERKQLRNRDD